MCMWHGNDLSNMLNFAIQYSMVNPFKNLIDIVYYWALKEKVIMNYKAYYFYENIFNKVLKDFYFIRIFYIKSYLKYVINYTSRNDTYLIL